MILFNLILHIRELRERPEKPVDTPKETKTTGDSDDNERCWECRRLLNDPDLKMFGGDPDDAVCIFNWQTLNFETFCDFQEVQEGKCTDTERFLNYNTAKVNQTRGAVEIFL